VCPDRFWDARTPQPAHVLQLPEKIYAMDTRGPFMVCCCADRKNYVYNLGSNYALESQGESTLKSQTR
jgi:mRNA export factor